MPPHRRRRLLLVAGTALLAILVTFVVYQGSFHFGEYQPATPSQTYLYWAVSTLIFILTITLGFMLTRTAVKIYVDRQMRREGSFIRTKLVTAALALTILPVLFLVLFSVEVLNRNLAWWFAQPAVVTNASLIRIANAIGNEAARRAQAQALWLAERAEVQDALTVGRGEHLDRKRLCREPGIVSALVLRADHSVALRLCDEPAPGLRVRAEVPVRLRDGAGRLVVETVLSIDIAREQRQLGEAVRDFNVLKNERDNVRDTYIQLLTLITLFIVFVATWVALFMARQISGPIGALLEAAREVRRGNLSHRVRVGAIDELATLVRATNDMIAGLEHNRDELERRRVFTEAILESIPTGVLSLAPDGRIRSVNRALRGIFRPDLVDAAARLDDLLPGEDATEIRYCMNRARRTGLAATQIELPGPGAVRHLYATVSALEDGSGGFVVVLEDTSELLQAQKAAAWHEVARRVAHEIKNPLTPISLCAERIQRQLARVRDPERAADRDRILRECATIIAQEVESLRTLVNEFSQFARFPSSQPVPASLNEVVENALAVFAGRLQGVTLERHLAPDLPPVSIDVEQFKRVVVNLVDNAAEAMENAPVRRLTVTTASPTPDTVELEIADTGCGISPEDKEKLFLPYFSTKNRGTGLGLAIVNRVLADHHARIQVEDNRPTGARFIVELHAVVGVELQAG